jgi:hypothetical protein
MNTAIAISSLENKHLGFLLLSGEGNQGDCIFSLVPKDAKVFDTSEFKYLENFGFRQAGEHRWISEGHRIKLSLSTGSTAEIDLMEDMLRFEDDHRYRITRTSNKAEQGAAANP